VEEKRKRELAEKMETEIEKLVTKFQSWNWKNPPPEIFITSAILKDKKFQKYLASQYCLDLKISIIAERTVSELEVERNFTVKTVRLGNGINVDATTPAEIIKSNPVVIANIENIFYLLEPQSKIEFSSLISIIDGTLKDVIIGNIRKEN